MNSTTKHILVKGKVQGVFFRKYTKLKADELNVKGWVKNTDDGDVEIMAHGKEDAVEKLIEWCWQGSPNAEVVNVVASNAKLDDSLKSFYIYRE